MKILLALLLALPLAAATYCVGSPGVSCDASYAASDAGLQSAIDAAAYGDTIVIAAGTIADVNVSLPVKNGNGWITMKCETMPPDGEGYRVNPTTNAPLCSLVAASSGAAVLDTAAETEAVSVDTSTDRITAWGGGALAEGTPIVLASSDRYGPYVCAAINEPLATSGSECGSAGDVDYLIERDGGMTLSNNTPVYVYGNPDAVPGGLAWNQWYYVAETGSSRIKLAATSGGSAIDITSATWQAAANVQVMPYPIVPYQVYYVRNYSAGTFQLSATASGSILDLTSTGQSVVAGRADQRVRGWKFQGIEIIKYNGGTRPFYLVGLGSGPLHPSQVAQDFIFDRMIVRGRAWQDGPRRSIFINAGNVLIKDSYSDENHDFNSQSNAVFILNSPGNVHLENNYLSGQGESVFIGGSTNSYPGLVPTNITMKRNWVDRPLEWYEGVYLSRQSATLLRAQTFSNADTCDTVAASRPGLQCTAYRPGNATPCLIDVASDVTVTTTPTGAWGFGVKDDCTFEFRFVGSSGDYTCTGDITCVAQASLDWTGIVNRIRSGTTTAGSISTTVARYRFDMRNNFETKNGQSILLKGNVFSGSWYSTGFDCHLTLNVQLGEEGQYWVQSSEHLIESNIFRTGVCALSAAGQSSHTNEENISGYRNGKRNVYRNNLAWDIGNWNWGKSTSHNASNRPIYLSASDQFLIDHNTTDGVGFYSVVTAGSDQFRDQTYTNNIFVPNSNHTAFPHLTNLDGGGNGWVSVMTTTSKCASGTCSWLNNAIVNPSGSSVTSQYPNSFLTGASQSVTSLGFTDYANRNFRIAAGDYAAGGANDATDGRALGADQDEIEALTGPLGADVEAGIPEFVTRARLVIEP